MNENNWPRRFFLEFIFGILVEREQHFKEKFTQFYFMTEGIKDKRYFRQVAGRQMFFVSKDRHHT